MSGDSGYRGESAQADPSGAKSDLGGDPADGFGKEGRVFDGEYLSGQNVYFRGCNEFNGEQWKAIDSGIAFYHKIAPVIKEGISFRYGPKIKSLRHPKGWQGMVRFRERLDGYVTIHTFGGEVPEVIEIPLPEGCPGKMAEVYAAGEADLRIEDRVLRYHPGENWEAAAVYLK